MQKLIAFIGPIGSGKTTAAELLRDKYGFTLISFASPLKRMLLELGLTATEVYGGDKNRPSIILGGKTPRYAMQTLGTEWGRGLIHPDLWLNATARLMDNTQGNVVIDDARFTNEFIFVKKHCGHLVRIYRDIEDHRGEQHSSERYYDLVPPDFSILNNGNFNVLQRHVFSVYNSL